MSCVQPSFPPPLLLPPARRRSNQLVLTLSFFFLSLRSHIYILDGRPLSLSLFFFVDGSQSYACIGSSSTSTSRPPFSPSSNFVPPPLRLFSFLVLDSAPSSSSLTRNSVYSTSLSTLSISSSNERSSSSSSPSASFLLYLIDSDKLLDLPQATQVLTERQGQGQEERFNRRHSPREQQR